MMAKDKETEPVVTTWIPAPHDHSAPVEAVVEVIDGE
jgi:hypothetical protein